MSGGIEVAGIAKRFGDVQALAGVDVTARPGEVVALLGPNGAGKSTLLRILATLVLPDAGTARLAGFDVVRQGRKARASVGIVVGDERTWYLRLSGRHNLEFFAALHGLHGREAHGRVDAALDAVGLHDAADRPVRGYSSGMRARLAVARADLGRPPILLLDEPTRSVDPVGAVEFREQILGIVAERGTTVLIATHDLHEAAAIAARSVVLRSGRVVAVVEDGADAAALERALLERAP